MIKGAIAHKEDTRSAQIPTENEQARGSRQARRNWTRKPMISKHKAAENKFLLTSQYFTCYSFSLATYLKVCCPCLEAYGFVQDYVLEIWDQLDLS